MAEITVEVVLALPAGAVLKRVSLDEKATVADALAAADIAEQGAVVDPDRLGIYGRRVNMADVLRNGDRVEIYRALVMDPKEARRRRVRDR